MPDEKIKVDVDSSSVRQASAEMQKLQGAVGGLEDKADALAQVLQKANASLIALSAGSREYADSAGSLAKQVDGLKEAHDSAVKSEEEAAKKGEEAAEKTKKRNEETGKSIKEVAEHVSEFGKSMVESAEKIEKFNPALGEQVRAYGMVTQEVGKTAGAIAQGFEMGGPAGGAIMGVTQLVTDLANAWLGEKERQMEAQEAFESAMSDQIEQISERNRARGEASADGWLEGLQKESEVIKSLNDVLGENVQMMEARQKAAFSVQEAKIRQNIARIQNDDSLSPEEKLKQVAQQKEQGERYKVGERLTEIRDRKFAARGEADQVDAYAKQKGYEVEATEQLIAQLFEKVGAGPANDLTPDQKTEYDKNKGRWDELRKQLPEMKKQAAAAQAAAETQKRKSDAIIGAAEIEDKATRDTYSIEAGTRQIETNAALKKLPKARDAGDDAGDIAERLARGKGVGADDRQKLHDVGQRLKDQVSDKDFALLLEIVDHLKGQAEVNQKVKRELEQLQRQSKASRSR